MVSRLVLGCGSACLGLIDQLTDRPGTLHVVDPDESRVEQLRAESVDATVGDPVSDRTLRDLAVVPDVIIVGGDDPRTNRRAAVRAHETFPDAYRIGFAGEDADADTTAAIESVVDRLFDPGQAIVEHLGTILRTNRADRLRSLHETIEGIDGTLGIFTHDNPDPDAIAAAVALAEIAGWHGVEVTPVYFGSISHQENRAFVNLLEFSLVNADPNDPPTFDAIALVDHSVPGVNDQLPPETDVDIVVDHHPPKQPVAAEFVDIREQVGATSTLLVDYIRGFGMEMDVAVATGLLYGIRVDTKDFAREITRADFEAAAYLLPRSDLDVLKRIESPSITADTLETIARAIRNRDHRGVVVASCVGTVADRDALAQAADRLLNMAGVSVSLVYGYDEGIIYLSARARGVDVDLGDALREAYQDIGSAGGHADMAGAQIEMGLFEAVESETRLRRVVEEVITERFYEVLEPSGVAT
ncbi:MAG: DHH family phosphoesterase [Halanaeroarchaeum sp.]